MLNTTLAPIQIEIIQWVATAFCIALVLFFLLWIITYPYMEKEKNKRIGNYLEQLSNEERLTIAHYEDFKKASEKHLFQKKYTNKDIKDIE